MSKSPIITFLAFKELNESTAVLAGRGVLDSTRHIDDPQYIVVPVVLHKDIFIYHSFDNGPLRLYRLKRTMPKVQYKVQPSTGSRQFDFREMLLNWEKNLRTFSRRA